MTTSAKVSTAPTVAAASMTSTTVASAADVTAVT